MKKKLTIEFETETDNEIIRGRVRKWLNEEFWNPSKFKIDLEDLKEQNVANDKSKSWRLEKIKRDNW